ncbi:peptide chain release factor 3 [Demequina lutea]|uniref:Peptide chain release factor 3 n=1 Tax=Demequina lutea TaxID=431489 RepID=A0A7Z0CKG1_9MICO|nr:peptide chain release factor 3 [Demequina lutea]NYI41685.1 peptide chain release factor 3 [Demequina lutea]
MSAPVLSAATVTAEARRRRSIAVISHPDAGKSTLTEALALHAHAIDRAGAVHGKGGRSGTVSDWLEIERTRGISITSAALQFEYGDHMINLLDTPGHADFSEDTYRVLTAVDAAIMLLDASKGLEPQTLKLFDVCRRRGVPVITFVNKWDRPGKAVLELCDELEQRIGLRPTPLSWPIGEAGRFVGLLDRADASVRTYRKTPGGANLAEETYFEAADAARELGEDYATAYDEAHLLEPVDRESFLAGKTTPMLFGAALANIGVKQLLDTVLELAPAPRAQPTDDGGANAEPGADADAGTEPVARAVDTPFSGFVFKIQAGMDRNHRDHLAYVRVCSGRFERGMIVTHERTGRPFATKYAQSVFGRDRETIEEAFPGDVVGLVNASNLTVGDTLFDPDGPSVRFPAMPAFAPEHFAVASVRDPGRSKQFRKAITQLEQEGVVQVLISESRGDANPIFGAVGPLQFEVAQFRMEHEFGAPMRLDTLGFSVARMVTSEDLAEVRSSTGIEVVRRPDGAWLALFRDIWHVRGFERSHQKVQLIPLDASEG